MGDSIVGFQPIPGLRNQPPAFWLNLGVKAVLVCLLAVGAFSGLQQFEGKAFAWRLATYPIAALVVPVIWLLYRRRAMTSTVTTTSTKATTRAESAYPYAVDILLVLPFLIDTIGNAVDFYDTIWWWDDVNHLVNWALLSGAVGALAWRNHVPAWQTLAYVVGFGAVTAILWEIAEYFSFIRFSAELETAYVDTLGDMTLGLIGSVVAGLIAAWAARQGPT